MTRTAIITASDSGIGKATAVTLAKAGCDVGVTWHRDEAGAQETGEEVRAAGSRAEIRRLDLTEPREAVAVIDELIDVLGGCDILVNNAGVGLGNPMLDVTLDEWQQTLQVDLTGAFLCSQTAARHMVERGAGGRIVNVTSVHEHVPKPGASAYCAAKGGLGMLTKVMALELAEHGITVNAVAPGEVATPMTGQHEADPGKQERHGTPLGRPGDAYEIAQAIGFLASPQASYITGESLVVDGGLLLTAAVQT